MASGNNTMEVSSSVVGFLNQGVVNFNGNMNVHGAAQTPADLLHEFSLPPLINSFRGRDEELGQLDLLFFDETQNVQKVVISGLAGMGKTELAKQFANQCLNKKRVEHVFWVKAEHEQDLKTSSTKLKTLCQYYKDSNCLYVFDNAVNQMSIFEYEPPNTNTAHKLLITSQASDWHDVESLGLEPLTSDSGIEIFRAILGKFYKNEDLAKYFEIGRIVSNIPLGLQVTAALVYQCMKGTGSHFNLQEYVDEMKQDQDEYIDSPIPGCIANSYKNSTYGAIKISINKLKNERNSRELALNALYVCAFLNPERITLNDLLKMSNIKQFLKQNKNRENKLRQALSLVSNYSLITFDSDSSVIKVHRLIQEVLRRYLRECDPDMLSACYGACVEAVFNYCMSKNIFTYAHLHFIFKNSDVDEVTFYNVYGKHKNLLVFNHGRILFNILLELIRCNCKESFKKILTDIIETFHLTNCTCEGTCEQVCTWKFISGLDLLHKAAMYNNVGVMELLLELNFDINNNRTNLQKTPLHVAAFWWNLESIKFLCEHGADVNATDSLGDTPAFSFIYGAIFHQRSNLDKVTEVFNLLCSQHNVNTTNGSGDTLLHAAAKWCIADLVTLLVTRYHLDVNAQNERTRATPLHAVIESLWKQKPQDDVIRIVQVLIRHGARLDLTDEEGRTPRQLALRSWFGGTEYLVPYLTNPDTASDN